MRPILHRVQACTYCMIMDMPFIAATGPDAEKLVMNDLHFTFGVTTSL
jgi:hypothetical protein